MVTKSGVLMETRKSLFVVIRRCGPLYDPQKPLEAQLDWEGHRLFMNALEAEGLARLAGPLGGQPRFFSYSEPTVRTKSTSAPRRTRIPGLVSSRPRGLHVGTYGSARWGRKFA
jgi:hypothetical protein